MPIEDVVKLNQRSTYILPTRAGLLILVIVILMMIGATNYQNNLAFLLTFLLVGIGLVAIVYTFKNLQGIQITLAPTQELFVDTPFSIKIYLQSQLDQAHFSIAIGFNRENLYLTDVPPEQQAEINLMVEKSQRGYWLLPRLIATSQFPFGWLKSWAYFQFKSPLVVYPKAIEPPSYLLQGAGSDEYDEGNKVSGNDELYGLKPYQQGEPLARVDWKAYARERGMYIREFASYQSQQHCFDWFNFPETNTEQRLSYLTFQVLEASAQNLSYSLILPNQKIELDEGENHRKKCLKALALFDQSFLIKEVS